MKERVWPTIAGLSLIAFPLMVLAGFIMRLNILSLGITDNTGERIAKFHDQWMFHAGQHIVFAALPFIIFARLGISVFNLPQRQHNYCRHKR